MHIDSNAICTPRCSFLSKTLSLVRNLSTIQMIQFTTFTWRALWCRVPGIEVDLRFF